MSIYMHEILKGKHCSTKINFDCILHGIQKLTTKKGLHAIY